MCDCQGEGSFGREPGPGNDAAGQSRLRIPSVSIATAICLDLKQGEHVLALLQSQPNLGLAFAISELAGRVRGCASEPQQVPHFLGIPEGPDPLAPILCYPS